METFIPFVLFVILGLIRQHELPQNTKTGFISATALPSSGIVSVMQTFCYGETSFHFDGDGLPHLPENSSLQIWLGKVNRVVKARYGMFNNYSVSVFDKIPSRYEEDVDHYHRFYQGLEYLQSEFPSVLLINIIMVFFR